MNLNRYCKECGTKVELDYEKGTAYCMICNKDIERKDTIAGYTRDARVSQLKAMHELMLNCNDENLYMSWICTMPDEPSEMDFQEIAIDDNSYNECWDKFLKLVPKNGMRW